METRERNTINYNNPPQSNQDSSPRLSTTSRRNETLNHLHQGNNRHGFKSQGEKLEPHRPGRNPNLDPNPAMLVSQALSQPQLMPLPPLASTIRPAVRVLVRYGECLKNHAANMGAHVLDGCGEFMPGGEDNTLAALKCAACECHRSFHRREVEGESRSSNHTHHMAPPLCAAIVHPPPVPSTQQQHRRFHHPMPPIMMAFGGGNGTPPESSSEEFNLYQTGVQLMARTTKKRFRTKFTQEQKEKMFVFAERIGWKIQKQDEEDVLRFCNEVGLNKQVFKVWMHNNKQAAKKK